MSTFAPISSATPKGLLYHYCSMSTFLSIIESRHLRLSSISHMSDQMEHRWFRTILRKVLEEKASANPQLMDTVDIQLLSLDPLTEPGLPLLFCCCFSTVRDRLSQWRAYADNGTGVAIGFNPKHLCPREGFDNLWLTDVVYSKGKQRAVAQLLADRLRRPFEKKYQRGRDFTATYIEAARHKSAAYAEEKEWRLLHYPYPQESGNNFGKSISKPQFFVSGRTLIPFVALSFDENQSEPPISEVVFGPSNPLKENRLSVKLLFEKHGWPIPKMLQSRATDRLR